MCFDKGRTSKEKLIKLIKEVVSEKPAQFSNIKRSKENMELMRN